MAEAILAGSGIYAIVNKINGKRYIGSAKRLQYRYAEHKRLLEAGKHHSPTLQRSWNKYGAGAFEYLVLEIVDDLSLLIGREQVWIDSAGCLSRRGFNISPTAGSPLGVRHTEQSKLNMSAAHKGKTLSAEHRAKIGLKSLGKKMAPEAVERRNAARRANGGFTQSAESYAKRTASRRARDGYKQTAEALQKREATKREKRAAQPQTALPA